MARPRFAKKIDTVHWTGFSGVAGGFSVGTIAVNMLPAQHLPETILRIRGEALVYLDGAQTPGGLAQVAMGLILVPDGTGATVLWSPVTDGTAPWIWFDTFHVGYEEYVTDVISSQVASGARRVIDSKAMRKVRNRELQLVVENVTRLSAVSVNVVLAGRVLSGI